MPATCLSGLSDACKSGGLSNSFAGRYALVRTTKEWMAGCARSGRQRELADSNQFVEGLRNELRWETGHPKYSIYPTDKTWIYAAGLPENPFGPSDTSFEGMVSELIAFRLTKPVDEAMKGTRQTRTATPQEGSPTRANVSRRRCRRMICRGRTYSCGKTSCVGSRTRAPSSWASVLQCGPEAPSVHSALFKQRRKDKWPGLSMRRRYSRRAGW